MKTIVHSKIEAIPNNGSISYNGNSFISHVFHHSDLFSLAALLKEFELYDVKGWQGLKKYDIEYASVQAEYTEPSEGFAPSKCHVIPVMVALKVDDEFEHAYTLSKFDQNKLSNDLCFNEDEKSISHWGWCILNTSDKDVKIVAICDVNYQKK